MVLDLLRALEMATTASFWSIMLWWSMVSRFRSCLASAAFALPTGIFVFWLTTSSTSEGSSSSLFFIDTAVAVSSKRSIAFPGSCLSTMYLSESSITFWRDLYVTTILFLLSILGVASSKILIVDSGVASGISITSKSEEKAV